MLDRNHGDFHISQHLGRGRRSGDVRPIANGLERRQIALLRQQPAADTP